MERLEVGSVVELSALDCRAWSPSHFTLVYSGIPYDLSPDVTSQISVQTEQELFEQMHIFDDPFSGCSTHTTRFRPRMNGV